MGKTLMVTTNEDNIARYRRLALALPKAEESSHFGAADFRCGGRIFATLAYGADGLGTLKLTPEQQADFLAEAPDTFTPAPKGWGRMGMTLVKLDAAEDVIAGSLAVAHRNVRDKPPAAPRKNSGKAAPRARKRIATKKQ